MRDWMYVLIMILGTFAELVVLALAVWFICTSRWRPEDEAVLDSVNHVRPRSRGAAQSREEVV